MTEILSSDKNSGSENISKYTEQGSGYYVVKLDTDGTWKRFNPLPKMNKDYAEEKSCQKFIEGMVTIASELSRPGFIYDETEYRAKFKIIGPTVNE